MFSETDGTVRVTLEHVLADGRGHAISVHHVTATRKGRSIDQRGGLFFTIVGGKITDIDECSPDIDEPTSSGADPQTEPAPPAGHLDGRLAGE